VLAIQSADGNWVWPSSSKNGTGRHPTHQP